MRVIYDLGANLGSNIRYFLLKSDLVVAVEANPILCDNIRQLFDKEIRSGRVIVENAIITKEKLMAPAVFHVSKYSHLLSQFPKPERISDFYEITVPTISVRDLIGRYGHPTYIKIDLEHYDSEVLEALFSAGIYPSYISAEAHTLNVLGLFIGLSPYRSFKLVDGPSTSRKSRRLSIATADGKVSCDFECESSGPFGDDLGLNWLSTRELIALLLVSGTGWKDIHASMKHKPYQGKLEIMRYLGLLYFDRFMQLLKSLTPKPLRSLFYRSQ